MLYVGLRGPEPTTGNAEADTKKSEPTKSPDPSNIPVPNQQATQKSEETAKSETDAAAMNSANNAPSSVIPTSPQYGVAIINDANDTVTSSSDAASEASAKLSEVEIKDIHSTPSKNDRFKVVKIASSEPFRRGRWKCMDYVDESPPFSLLQGKFTTQNTSPSQVGGTVYMQTQSLPPAHIQQMLVQGGFTTTGTPQYFTSNVQAQMVPQTQYFYPAVQNQGNVQPQSLPQQIVTPASLPPNSMPQYISTTQGTYYQPTIVTNAVPSTFSNVQFVQQPTMMQNQNSAFVPASQNQVQQQQNMQQGQSYSSRPNITQTNVAQGQTYAGDTQNIVVTQSQPLVNGYAFPPQTINEQQIAASNIRTQVAKNVILNTSNVNPQVNQNQIQNVVQNQNTANIPVQNQQETQVNQNCAPAQPQTVPIQNVIQQNQPYNEQNPAYHQQQQQQQQHQQQQQQQHQQQQQQQQHQQQQQQQVPHSQVLPNVNQIPQNMNPVQSNVQQNIAQNVVVTPQNYDPNVANNVYTNAQFTNVSNMPTPEMSDPQHAENVNEVTNTVDVPDENSGDVTSRTNPVVNAIDNKIEQAMDLVKSHLMFTVREEVEVLKEKITELMERIQQLETENNFLRSQLPKSSATNPNTGTEQPPPQQ